MLCRFENKCVQESDWCRPETAVDFRRANKAELVARTQARADNDARRN